MAKGGALVRSIPGENLDAALTSLVECREYLLLRAQATIDALATKSGRPRLSFLELKREIVTLTNHPKGIGKGVEGLGEVINQGATLSRVVHALEWAKRAVGSRAHVWVHPTTGSSVFTVGNRKMSHDIVVAPSKECGADDKLWVFEVSDTIADGEDSNDKLPKDLYSLGLLDRASDEEAQRARIPDEAAGPCARHLVTSPGLASVIRENWMTVTDHAAALVKAGPAEPPELPRNTRHKEKREESLAGALELLLDVNLRASIARELVSGASGAAYVCSKQNMFKDHKLKHAQWMPALRSGDHYVLVTFLEQKGVPHDTSIFEVCALASVSRLP